MESTTTTAAVESAATAVKTTTTTAMEITPAMKTTADEAAAVESATHKVSAAMKTTMEVIEVMEAAETAETAKAEGKARPTIARIIIRVGVGITVTVRIPVAAADIDDGGTGCNVVTGVISRIHVGRGRSHDLSRLRISGRGLRVILLRADRLGLLAQFGPALQHCGDDLG